MSAQPTPQGWNIDVIRGDKRHRIAADFVVDASGRPARFSRSQGSRLTPCDNQIAIVGFLRGRSEMGVEGEDTILLEASEYGWWYCARLHNDRSVIMFISDPDLLMPGQNRILSTWRLRLAQTRHVRALAESFRILERLTVCSARTQRLNNIAGRDWLAVGDAAMAFDPLSSKVSLRHSNTRAGLLTL